MATAEQFSNGESNASVRAKLNNHATEINNKVDKVTDKGLSENDYTDADQDKLAALPTNDDLNTALGLKVDKSGSKQLSDENYTSAEKTKLGALPTNSDLNTSLAATQNANNLTSGTVPDARLSANVPIMVADKIQAANLPSYVDDILEYANFAALPVTGETGKIYITIDNNKEFRWSGSVYIELVSSPGTTDNVPEGATNKYWTAARTIASALTGYVAAVGNTAVAASDTILGAFQKIGGSIADIYTNLALKANLDSPALTGTPTAPTAATTTSTTQLANTAFVQQELTANTLFVNTGVFTGGTSGNRLNIIQTYNDKTANYTAALSDANIGTGMNVASANNFTVPTNASVPFVIGTQLPVLQIGAGQTSIVASGGVTILSAGGALKLRVQYSHAVLIKRATDTWILAGDITT